MMHGKVYEFMDIPYIVGANSFDGLASPPFNMFNPLGKNATLPDLLILLGRYFDKNEISQLENLYDLMNTKQNVTESYMLMNGDSCVVCPTNEMARLMNKKGVKNWLYMYDR
eukprot:UN07938